MYLFHYFCRNPKRCSAEPCLRNNGVYVNDYLFLFLRFFPLCSDLYPLCTLCPVSSCHLFIYNTQHRHPCHRRNSFIPLYSVRTSYLCLDCPVFCLFVFTFNTQHKHPCPGGVRTRNPSKRSALDSRLRPRGHWDRFCRRVVWSVQISQISPEDNSVCHII